MTKFTKSQRQELRDLVVQCIVKRFSREESFAYIKGRFKHDVCIEWIDKVKADLIRGSPERLDYLRKSRYAFIDEVFRSKDEVENYMKELWVMFHKNPDNPNLQKDLIKELHQLTITRSNIIQAIKYLSGVNPNPPNPDHNGKKTFSEYLDNTNKQREQQYRDPQEQF